MNDNEYREDFDRDIELLSEEGFEKLRSKHLKKKIWRRIGVVALTLLIIGAFVVLSMYLFLKVGEVNVDGNTRYTDEEIVKASGIKEGDNLLALRGTKVSEGIKNEFAFINEVDVSRSLPSTVNITVGEENASYVCELSGEYFILSKTLRVLERGTDLGSLEAEGATLMKLPTVKYAVVGEDIRFENDLTFEYVETLIAGLEESKLEDRITEIDLTSKYNIYLNYENRFRIYIGDSTDVSTKLVFASMMINNFESDRRGEVDAHDISVGSVILAD